MPYSIRIFLKFVYDEAEKVHTTLNLDLLYNILADFLISGWLVKVCFLELNQYGLTKTFFVGENCHQNMKLLAKVMEAIFRMDDFELRGRDEIFSPFLKLFE
mmetsp:Transcript_7122/g.5386  ORF Transcript_7122/g.5386 Transcript_7122/m.5386 type:complete len:102 (+) Transcript_7122:17-322(+)